MKSVKEPPKRYSLDYKRDAARLVVEGGKSIASAAVDIGVSPSTFRGWVSEFRKNVVFKSPAAGKLTPVEQELAKMTEENRKLKVQVSFLKKTMAYFVEQPQ